MNSNYTPELDDLTTSQKDHLIVYLSDFIRRLLQAPEEITYLEAESLRYWSGLEYTSIDQLIFHDTAIKELMIQDSALFQIMQNKNQTA